MNLTGSKRLSISVDADYKDASTTALTILLKSCHAPIDLIQSSKNKKGDDID